jgi:hypothetical protein
MCVRRILFRRTRRSGAGEFSVGYRIEPMKAFITAVLVAAILAIAAGTTLSTYVQKTATDAYLEPSARL